MFRYCKIPEPTQFGPQEVCYRISQYHRAIPSKHRINQNTHKYCFMDTGSGDFSILQYFFYSLRLIDPAAQFDMPHRFAATMYERRRARASVSRLLLPGRSCLSAVFTSPSLDVKDYPERAQFHRWRKRRIDGNEEHPWLGRQVEETTGVGRGAPPREHRSQTGSRPILAGCCEDPLVR